MPRSAHSAALFEMHRRPSARKRVSAGQSLRLLSIALAVSLFLESLPRCVRSQVSSSAISGRLRSFRTARRCCGVMPLISRSVADRASMRSTAAIAIGAFCSRAKSKNLRRACAQHAASTMGPPLRDAS